MDELSQEQEAILAECLEALVAGAEPEECLARYGEHGGWLRPFLELRARLHSEEIPEPSPAAYEAGRQALVRQAAQEQMQRTRRPFVLAAGTRWRMPAQDSFGTRWRLFAERVGSFFTRGWGGLESPLARVAAASALLLVLGGGALGVSAAAGFEPARDVLSTIQVTVEKIAPGEDGSKDVQDEGGDGDAPGEPPSADEYDEPAAPPASDRDETIKTPEPDADEPLPEPTPQRNDGPDTEPQPTPRTDDIAPTPSLNQPAPGGTATPPSNHISPGDVATPPSSDVAPTPVPHYVAPTPSTGDLAPTPTPSGSVSPNLDGTANTPDGDSAVR